MLAAAFKHSRLKDPSSPTLDDAWRFQWQADITAIAGVLEKDNPKFDAKRFWAACGWEKFSV